MPLDDPSVRDQPDHTSTQNNLQFQPDQTAKALMDRLDIAARGDVPTAVSLSNLVQDLKKSDHLNAVGDNLQKDGCGVVRDEKGNVKELVFDDHQGHKLDMKIGQDDKVTINGQDDKQLGKANSDFVQKMNAAEIKGDDRLSPKAKAQVTKMEDALLKGDSKAFMDAVKDFKGDPQLGKEVAQRLQQDLPGYSVNYGAGTNGEGDLIIKGPGNADPLIFVPTVGKPGALLGAGMVPVDAGDPAKYVDGIGKDLAHFKSTEDSVELPLNGGQKLDKITPEAAAQLHLHPQYGF